MRLRVGLLTALTAVALGLRLWGIGFGLPAHLHPDESAHVLEPIALAKGVPNALSYANPPLYKELLLGVYALTGHLSATSDELFVVARATSAVLGALTVPVVYLLALALRGPGVGLVAAAVTSVAFLLVRESHFAVNDALVTLLATCALFACVRVASCGSRRNYALAGALIGLTFAAKYQAAAVVASFVLAWSATRRIRGLLLAGGTALLVALLAFPWLVLEPSRVLSDFYVFDLLPSRLGYDGIDPAGGYGYYLSALAIGLGWPLVLLAALGLAHVAVKRELSLLVVASFPVVLYLALGASRMYFARFLLPALPVLIVLAAVAISDLLRPRWLALILASIAIAWTAKDSVQFDVLLAGEDTRLEAASWIEAQLPAGARIAADSAPFGVPLARAERTPAALYDSSLDDYRQAGIEYFVTSSFVADARPIDPARDEHRRAFNAALRDGAEQIAEFRSSVVDLPFVYDRIYAPYDQLALFRAPGPTIRVYRLKPS